MLPSQRPLFIAHRGWPARAPENSATGFELARDAGARVVELDARATGDGLLVVLHDPTPERLTGASAPAVRQTARALVAQTYRGRPDERLILLDEALALLAGRVVVDIEIKADDGTAPGDLARRALAALERAGSPGQVIVTSDSTAVIEEVKARAPGLATGLIVRWRDPRAPVDTARRAGCDVLVINQRRVDAALAAAAHGARLAVWTYTVNDAADARRLIALGCDGIITDDAPRLALACGVPPPAEDRASAPDDGVAAEGDGAPPILALDVGSTRIKGALVSPRHGVRRKHGVALPTLEPAAGVVEHDPDAVVAAVRDVIEALAADAPARPLAAGFALARSTGLWVDGATLAPVTPAISWRDARGAEIVARLEPRRARLEEIAGYPLDTFWTAVKGRAVRPPGGERAGERLAPLGSYIVARLTNGPLTVDATLANRMYLLDAATLDWSDELLAAFSLPREVLPRLVPTVGDHGAVAWPGGGAVPLRATVGDQQAAYVGLRGPAGGGLVLNIGTAAFVMRPGSARETLDRAARRAPLWTSPTRPAGQLLIELSVVLGTSFEPRVVARALAWGDEAPRREALRLAGAVAAMGGAGDRAVTVAGGALASPHLCALLRSVLPLAVRIVREPEATLVGAARLAAAGAGIGWSHSPDVLRARG